MLFQMTVVKSGDAFIMDKFSRVLRTFCPDLEFVFYSLEGTDSLYVYNESLPFSDCYSFSLFGVQKLKEDLLKLNLSS